MFLLNNSKKNKKWLTREEYKITLPVDVENEKKIQGKNSSGCYTATAHPAFDKIAYAGAKKLGEIDGKIISWDYCYSNNWNQPEEGLSVSYYIEEGEKEIEEREIIKILNDFVGSLAAA